MSGFSSQNQENYKSSNGYVDFNQFILQHNFNEATGSSDDYRQYSLYRQVPQLDFNMLNPQFVNHEHSDQTFGFLTDELAANSNLIPTAAEFVPRFSALSIDENIHQTNESTSKILPSNSCETETHNNSQNETGAIKKHPPRNFNQRFNCDNRSDYQDSYYRGNGYYTKKKPRVESGRSSKRRDNWRREYKDFECYSDSSNDTLLLSKNNKTDHSQHSQNKLNSPQNISGDRSEHISQRDKLIDEIEGRKLECLVCVEAIKSHQPIWSCSNCYHILHLNCTIKWALSSKSEDGWRCPACQNTSKEIPRDYYCFCGKTKNPVYNRNDVAHSCGEVCGRKEVCCHACTLLCHPGPCPFCQVTVTRYCNCGKTAKIMQCYLKDYITCDKKCEKLLSCQLHTCHEICHNSKCADCEVKIYQKCYCGKIERQISCTREPNDKKLFSCGKICSKQLSCKNHFCKDACHSGDCRSCKLTPDVVTFCPCGKTSISPEQRNSCQDPIPVCNSSCGRVLKCGPPDNPHHCVSKCHLGNCPPCNKQTAVRCRCGHMDQMIKCRQLCTRADDARCKKRCTKKRHCGKHKCNQECCIDIDHLCPMPCNYTLSCGKHKCDQTCHRGNCAPCYRSSFDELFCECGANVIYPPVACGTKRPICDKLCTRQHRCNHPVQHNCHSASTCPPCMIFTTKFCHGGHEQRKTIPCSQDSFSCGLACNKELSCKRHKCIKPCHTGPCESQSEVCKQTCKISRVICNHKCNALCHDGDCPDIPCKENVEVTCQCGHRKQMRTCHDYSSEYRRIATAKLASSMQEMQRGNLIELSDILGPIKISNNKTLECSEECKILERNRRLAIGLQIRNPDLSSKLLTRYTDFVRGWGKKDLQLVKMIHDKLTELVKLAKESKQRSRSHSFPTMNKEKRQLVHEMCTMFGVDSVAYDAEPNRNVVATAYKERSWLPAMSVMEVLQRERGQRRVPVPSNNAWKVKK